MREYHWKMYINTKKVRLCRVVNGTISLLPNSIWDKTNLHPLGCKRVALVVGSKSYRLIQKHKADGCRWLSLSLCRSFFCQSKIHASSFETSQKTLS